MMTKLLRSLFCSVLLLVTVQAQASLEIIITDGVDSARPIAVLPFTFRGTTLPKENIAEVVAADLMRSGKFSPIPLLKCRSGRQNPQKLIFQPGHAKGLKPL